MQAAVLPAPVSRLPCRLAWPTLLTRMATATLRLRPFLRARCVCCQDLCRAPTCASASTLPLRRSLTSQPVEFLSDPAASSTDRCKRRWNDLQCVPQPQLLRCASERRALPLLRASSFVLFPRPSSSLSACRLLRLDALSPGTTVGPTARFASEETVYRQLRERACFDAARRSPRAQGLLAPASCAAASTTAARPPRAPAVPPPAGYLLFVGCIEAKPGAEPKHACA